ncbi:MAG TPA: sulfite oxidase [Candidatus Limnocylindrales bacterium]|nr:sulfite oxidase [Candidatus Limnocylindrales bacterium]
MATHNETLSQPTYVAPGPPTDGPLTAEELALAVRNRGMPLEALRYDLTPTGLHYLLIHFDIPATTAQSWRLGIGGAVEAPFAMDMDEIRALPARTLAVTMECAGNGRARLSPRPMSQPWLYEAIGTAEWTGTSVWPLIERARPRSDVVDYVFTGADRGIQGEIEHDYARSLTEDELRRGEVMLVYEMNGRPLEPQHGYPLRLIVPGWYGMTSVKWLRSIEAVTTRFEGYQQTPAYHFADDAENLGEAVTRIRPRALMVPPGMPDFFSRHRIVDAGAVALFGRAWSGRSRIERVEVAVDGVWTDAVLGNPLGEFAWRSWTFDWQAETGEHVLSVRATDATGDVQPTDQPWNYQGMGNNLTQVVPVTVR